MKARLARFFMLVAVPTFGMSLSAIGCSADSEAEPSVAEEQEAVAEEQGALSTEEGAGLTDEGALTATSADTLTVSPPSVPGICWQNYHCAGGYIAIYVTASVCKSQFKGKSWRALGIIPSRCIPLR